jgi:2-phospho-L-lactate transferase/gluconeogenesis factor (CofD/UPF0052 family)
VVNTGDDMWLHGLRVCPDLDTCMYTLGGGIDPERGWGRAGETWVVKEELAGYGPVSNGSGWVTVTSLPTWSERKCCDPATPCPP